MPPVPSQSPPLVQDDLGNTIKYLLAGGIHRQAFVQLNNSQLLTIPTVSIEIVPKISSTVAIIPVLAYFRKNFLSAYAGGGAATAILQLAYGTAGQTGISADCMMRLSKGIMTSSGTDGALISGPVLETNTSFFAQALDIGTLLEGFALTLSGSGGANYTGGNIANFLKVNVVYLAFDSISNQFV